MATTKSAFTARACPYCGSNQRTTLLRLDAHTLFRGNWSYIAEARAGLGLAEGQTFPIDSCSDCGFVYAGLLPEEAFMRAVYERVIDAEEARRDNLSPENAAAKMNYLATLLKLISPKAVRCRILDFGCGFGPALQLLSAVPSVQAIGYETSSARVEDLRRRGLDASLHFEDVADRGPFDAVILDNVLEHVPTPADTLARVARVCQPEAILFVSVPDLTRDAIARFQGADRKVPMDINPWEHLNYFDLAHLDGLLARCKFQPCGASTVPDSVDIGVRPLKSAAARFGNAVASVPRLLRYAARGDAVPTVTRRFYRLTRAS